MHVFALAVTLHVATQPASAQTEVFDTVHVAESIEALRTPLPSLDRPAPPDRANPEIGTLVEAPVSVTMRTDTVDTLPALRDTVLRSRRVDVPVGCRLEVDVDARGRVDRVDVAFCDIQDPALTAWLERQMSRRTLVPGQLAGRPVAVADVPLTVEIRPTRLVTAVIDGHSGKLTAR